MSQQFQAPPRKKNLVDYAGFRLNGEKLRDAEGRPSLQFSVVKNKVRVDVYTNVPNDKNRGNIRGELDAPVFFIYLKNMELAIKGEPGNKQIIELKDFLWTGGKRSPEKMPQARLIVGKNDKGVVYTALMAYDQDRPKIQFFFDISFNANLMRNGTPLTQAEGSELYAEAFRKALCEVTPNVLNSEFVEPEKKDKNGGQQGGGKGQYNNNRSGGGKPQGGGGGRQAGFDDDFAAPAGGAAAAGDDDFGWGDADPM